MDNSTLNSLIANKFQHGDSDFPEILQSVKIRDFKHAAELLETALDEEGIDEIEMMGIFSAISNIDKQAMSEIQSYINDEYLKGVLDGYLSDNETKN